jgi:hypothetical protein
MTHLGPRQAYGHDLEYFVVDHPLTVMAPEE